MALRARGQSRVSWSLVAHLRWGGAVKETLGATKRREGSPVKGGCLWDGQCSSVTLPPILDLHVPGYRGSHYTARTDFCQVLGLREAEEEDQALHSSDHVGARVPAQDQGRGKEGSGGDGRGLVKDVTFSPPPEACGVDFEIRAFCAKSLEEKSHKR